MMDRGESSASVSSCDVCEEDFSSLEDLQQHVQHVHHLRETERKRGEGRNETALDRLNIREQRQDGDFNERLKCDRCDLTFCSKNSLKTHVRIVHNSIRDFQCGVCEVTFATVSGVKRHLTHHHSLGNGGYSTVKLFFTFLDLKSTGNHGTELKYSNIDELSAIPF